MEKITVNEKEYTISEIKYKDLISLGEVSKEDASMKLMELSTGITKEEYDNLSLKDGLAIQKKINEINGLMDFQQPLKG